MNWAENMLEVLAIMLMLILALIMLPIYIICGLLDLTYHERHKKELEQAKKCPYFIEGEEEHGQKQENKTKLNEH